MSDILTEMPEKPGAMQPERDLIMRPTTAAAGLYDDSGLNGDDDGPPVLVVTHEDKKNYIMVWCTKGEGAANLQEGDLLFEGAYLKDHRVEYDKTSGVQVEEVPITFERL